uniref:Uncharacterized protein n=1 Tax=Naja naja TaxID=35670 RepID=A0A8C6VL19_NAJNA
MFESCQLPESCHEYSYLDSIRLGKTKLYDFGVNGFERDLGFYVFPLIIGKLNFNNSCKYNITRRVGLLQQENNSLCVRLANIYHGSGMVDCWNEYQQKSVFRQKQNIELVKISLENQAIFKRLRDRKATYDRKQYEKDWQASAFFPMVSKVQPSMFHQ